jgi:hypothetical protein
MAKMTTDAAGINTISGALLRPKKENGHKHGNYLIAVHRKAGSADGSCQRLYSFSADRYQRSTQPDPDELARRLKFKQIRQAVVTRARNLATLTQDQLAFGAARKAGSKYTTFHGWLTGKGYEYWNDSTHTVDWPNSWDE